MKKLLFLSLVFVSSFAFPQDTSLFRLCISSDQSINQDAEWSKAQGFFNSRLEEVEHIELTFLESDTEKPSRQEVENSILNVVNALLNFGVKPNQISFEQANPDSREVNKCELSNIELLIQLRKETTYHPKPIKADELLKPFKSAPFTSERFKINSSKESVIRTKRGNKIFIPANSFQDRNGNLTDSVEITFTEYTSQVDIFLSGIPMSYVGELGSGNLESAGMFEISARKGNTEITLDSDKTIEIDFVSVSSDSDFDFFFFDSERGWESSQGLTNETYPDSTIQNYDSGDRAVLEYLRQTNILFVDSADRTTNEEKFNDILSSRDDLIERLKRKKRFKDEDLERKLNRYVRKYSPVSLSFSKRTRKSNKKDLTFTIWCEPSIQEWSIFRNYDFEYRGEHQPEALKNLLKSKSFIDLRLRLDSLSKPVLFLKGVNDFTVLPIKKFRSDKLDVYNYSHLSPSREKVMTEKRVSGFNRAFDNRYRTYSRQLKRQEKRIQIEADRRDRKSFSRHQKALLKAWKKSKSLMTNIQKEMSFKKWETHCTTRKPHAMELLGKMDKSELLVRKISLDRLGVYNIDRLKELKRPKNVIPEFLANGQSVNWHRTYLFDKTINSVFTFRKSQRKITLDPYTLKTLIVMDTSGNLFILEENILNEINGTLKVPKTLKVKPLDDSIQSIESLQLSLGF